MINFFFLFFLQYSISCNIHGPPARFAGLSRIDYKHIKLHKNSNWFSLKPGPINTSAVLLSVGITLDDLTAFRDLSN